MAFKIKRNATDKAFSDYIRTRDKYTCRICGIRFPGLVAGLDCAHLFPGRLKNLKWDERAAVALCSPCHYLGNKKNITGYDAFDRGMSKRMRDDLIVKWVGVNTFMELTILSKKAVKISKEQEKEIRDYYREKRRQIMIERDEIAFGAH